MTDSTEKMRGAFEAWHKAERTQPLDSWCLARQTYKNAHVRARWEGWQAATRNALTRAAEICRNNVVTHGRGEPQVVPDEYSTANESTHEGMAYAKAIERERDGK